MFKNYAAGTSKFLDENESCRHLPLFNISIICHLHTTYLIRSTLTKILYLSMKYSTYKCISDNSPLMYIWYDTLTCAISHNQCFNFWYFKNMLLLYLCSCTSVKFWMYVFYLQHSNLYCVIVTFTEEKHSEYFFHWLANINKYSLNLFNVWKVKMEQNLP